MIKLMENINKVADSNKFSSWKYRILWWMHWALLSWLLWLSNLLNLRCETPPNREIASISVVKSVLVCCPFNIYIYTTSINKLRHYFFICIIINISRKVIL
jgi:cyanate permease